MHIKQIILMDKMSIAYQLYLMSNTNHIIIPLPNSHSSPQRTLSFSSSPFTSPLHVAQPPTQNFSWRKSNSAFSRFKVRKDRTNKNQLSFIQDLKHQQIQKQRKVSLVIRALPNPTLKQYIMQQMQTQCPFGYYDPNQAPLCELTLKECQRDSCMEIQGSLASARPEKQRFEHVKNSLSSSNVKQEHRPLQKKDSKVYTRPIQLMIPEEDDPFIIIRKDSQIKTSKQTKTKFIKKQELPTPKKQPEHEYDPKFKVGNKIVEKSVLRAQELMKNISSVGFTPPIKVESNLKHHQREKSKVIEISEQHQVIQIESSSESSSDMKEEQIQIQ